MDRTKQQNKRNDYIELLRFIASIMVLMHHSYWSLNGQEKTWCFGGYIFVEFFFMLTGYFTGNSFRNGKVKYGNSFAFAVSKVKKIFPMTTICIVALYMYRVITQNIQGADLTNLLLDMPFEILYLRDFGLTATNYFGHFWYLSAMVIVLCVYGWLADSAPKFFHGVVLPLSPVLYGSMFLNTLDGMGHWGFEMSVVQSDIIRGFAGIGLGWFISDIISGWNFQPTKLTRSLLTVVELFALAVAVSFVWNNAYSPYDIHIIACFALIIAISASGKSFTSEIHSKLFRFLGRLSLPIYICHVWIEEIVHNIYIYIYAGCTKTSMYIAELIVSILASILAGMLLMLADSLWRRATSKLRHYLIITDPSD